MLVWVIVSDTGRVFGVYADEACANAQLEYYRDNTTFRVWKSLETLNEEKS